MLHALVQVVDTAPGAIGIGLTLTVAGAVVTGQLIGIREYTRLFGDQLGGAFSRLSPKAGKGLKQSIVESGEQAFADMKEEEDYEPDAASEREHLYVHLKDAQFVWPDGFVPAIDGFLWRGRIDAVSGFALGQLGHGPRGR